MIDYQKIAQAALSQAEGICCELFPAGARDGAEFRIGSLAGESGKSLSINLRSGKWKDFASGDCGGDLISLWAGARDMKMGDAARELDERLHAGGFTETATHGNCGSTYKPSNLTPQPFGPETPAPTEKRRQRDGEWESVPISRSWAYRDAEGRLVGYVCRVDYPDGSKDIYPYTFCKTDDGTEKWAFHGFLKPKPLYNLEKILSTTGGVFGVEGEKCTDTLQSITRNAVFTWQGGAQAAKRIKDTDWSHLNGRSIVLLPDADSATDERGKLLPQALQPGISAMLYVEEALTEAGAKVFIALPPKGWKNGYDIADAIKDGFSFKQLVEHVNAQRKAFAVTTVREYLENELNAYAEESRPLEQEPIPEPEPEPELESQKSSNPAKPDPLKIAAKAKATIAAKIAEPPVEAPKPLAESMHGIQSIGITTEVDAAARFTELMGKPSKLRPNARNDVRFAPGVGWMIWDGKRWGTENSEFLIQEILMTQAQDWTRAMLQANDGDFNASAVKGAKAFESSGHIAGISKLARSSARVMINGKDLDSDPLILNVENGILDIRTGTLMPHDKNANCTKLANVSFDPDATHPALETFLATLRETCGTDVVDFLARAFGYCMTGEVSADALFLLQGEGGGGKTTILEAVTNMLGDYTVKLPFESFCATKYGRSPGGASCDIMMLRGARMALAEEGDRSATLDAGRVKELTGGGTITARGLYDGYVMFKPTHHLWLCSNFEPRADADDTGVWRRMIKLKFLPVPAEKRDPSLREALIHDPAARSALLAWIVRGSNEWIEHGGGRDGLGIPSSVAALTEDYRKRLDTVGQWLDESLEIGGIITDKYATASNKDLRKSYEGWCEDNGAMPLGLARFSEALRSRGLEKERTQSGVCWKGIRIAYGGM